MEAGPSTGDFNFVDCSSVTVKEEVPESPSHEADDVTMEVLPEPQVEVAEVNDVRVRRSEEIVQVPNQGNSQLEKPDEMLRPQAPSEESFVAAEFVNVKMEPLSEEDIKQDAESLHLVNNSHEIKTEHPVSILGSTIADTSDIAESEDTKSLNTFPKELIKKKSASRTPEEEIFSCEFCDRKFSRKNNLARHQRDVHFGIKPFVCDICNKTFTQKRNLTVHKNCVHLGVKPFPCEFCKKTFSQKVDLSKHLNSQHLRVRPFKCEICSMDFLEKYRLVKHVSKEHFDVKRYVCDICKERFDEKKELMEHKTDIHSDFKYHICDICKKGFVEESQLTKHIEEDHADPLTNDCDMCGQTFTRRSFLIEHQNRVHFGMRHFCQYCQKSFSTRGNLTTHEKLHTSERRFQCDVCKKKFARKSGMERHIHTVHRMETFIDQNPEDDMFLITGQVGVEAQHKPTSQKQGDSIKSIKDNDIKLSLGNTTR